MQLALVFPMGGGCSTTIVVPGWAAAFIALALAAPRLAAKLLEKWKG